MKSIKEIFMELNKKNNKQQIIEKLKEENKFKKDKEDATEELGR